MSRRGRFIGLREVITGVSLEPDSNHGHIAEYRATFVSQPAPWPHTPPAEQSLAETIDRIMRDTQPLGAPFLDRILSRANNASVCTRVYIGEGEIMSSVVIMNPRGLLHMEVCCENGVTDEEILERCNNSVSARAVTTWSRVHRDDLAHDRNFCNFRPWTCNADHTHYFVSREQEFVI